MHDIYCSQIQHKLLHDNITDKAALPWQTTAVDAGVLGSAIRMATHCRPLGFFDKEVPRTITIVHIWEQT